MLRKILTGLAIFIIVLGVVALFLPTQAKVERSVVINAPASAVFARVNTYAGANDWSPWYAYDPGMQQTISGPAAGVGATMAWSSDKVGSGSQTIVESVPDRLVKVKLDFGDQGGGIAWFALEPQGDATKVTWAFESDDFGYNLPMRYMGLMFDGMIGGDYETGLANLKRVVESGA